MVWESLVPMIDYGPLARVIVLVLPVVIAVVCVLMGWY